VDWSLGRDIVGGFVEDDEFQCAPRSRPDGCRGRRYWLDGRCAAGSSGPAALSCQNHHERNIRCEERKAACTYAADAGTSTAVSWRADASCGQIMTSIRKVPNKPRDPHGPLALVSRTGLRLQGDNGRVNPRVIAQKRTRTTGTSPAAHITRWEPEGETPSGYPTHSPGRNQFGLPVRLVSRQTGPCRTGALIQLGK
jgi:hypothetical protein